jgi:hypothetical protein
MGQSLKNRLGIMYRYARYLQKVPPISGTNGVKSWDKVLIRHILIQAKTNISSKVRFISGFVET